MPTLLENCESCLKPRLLLAMLAALVSCTKKDTRQRDSGPPPVRVQAVHQQTLPRTLTLAVPLTGRTQADVYSKVIGRIDYIGPKEGQRVKVGELLFKVERADGNDNFLTMPMQSPIAGWVGRWSVATRGEHVTPQDPVVTIVDDEYLRGIVYLSSQEWLLINDKTAVKVAIGSDERPGHVVSISRAADPGSGRGSVTFELENKDHRWRSGMVANVVMQFDPKPRMMIATTSLLVTDQGAFVYVIEGEKALRKQIQYQLIDQEQAEVLSGINDGAQIVIAGANALSDGRPVKIVEQ